MSKLVSRWAIAIVALIGSLAWVGGASADTYTYDRLGRVVSVVTADGKETRYTYDAAGNRTALAISTTAASPPTASAKAQTWSFGDPQATIDILGSNPNNWTITGLTKPQFGAATISGNSILYNGPAAPVSAIDDFSYTVSNSAGLTASAPIAMTLTIDPPVADNETIDYHWGGTDPGRNPPITFNPLDGDTDPGDLGLSITAVSAPQRGTMTFTATSVTYRGPTNYAPGPDTFAYTVTNTENVSDEGQITVNLINDPPLAVVDTIQVTFNTPLTFDPRVNDNDPTNDPFVVHSVTQPATGTGSASRMDNSATYTPPQNWSGTTEFNYRVRDSFNNVSLPRKVTVVVNPFQPLGVSLSDTSWTWMKFGSNPAHIDDPITCVASGGVPPYTYAWSRVSGDSSTAAVSPTGSATAWKRTPEQEGDFTSVWRCTLDDSAGGGPILSSNINVTFHKEGLQ